MYRIAIVDDEAIVRKGMMNLVSWSSLGCKVVCEAADGQDLLDKIDWVQPDIVITDIKMPRIDGLGLCAWLHQHRPETQIIMLTAYADFEYARQSMKYGVTDYVTKSGGMKEVTHAVRHAIEQMEERRLLQSQAELHKENLETLQQTFFKNVFDGLWTEQNALSSRAAQLHLDLSTHSVLCMEFDMNPDSLESDGLRPLEPVCDFLILAFKDYRCWCVPLSSTQLAVVLAPQGDAELALDSTERICRRLLQVLTNMLGCPIFIGVGSTGSCLSELAQTCLHAKETLNRRFLEDESHLYFYTEEELISPEGCIPVNEAIDRLITAIGRGDQQETENRLSELFELQKLNLIPAEILKSQAMTINAGCGRLHAEHKLAPDNIYEKEIQFYQSITACRSLEEYKRLLTPVVLGTCRQLQASAEKGDFVFLAREYIQQNYIRDITLNDIAEQIHVTPSYLCRLYRESTGRTVMADVNALKINRAKHLLRQPGETVQSAALAIGMADAAYFSHFFKKHVGMSPRKFQQQ